MRWQRTLLKSGEQHDRALFSLLCSRGLIMSLLCSGRRLTTFRGDPDPFKGELPNQKVRETAKETLDAMFAATDLAARPAQSSINVCPTALQLMEGMHERGLQTGPSFGSQHNKHPPACNCQTPTTTPAQLTHPKQNPSQQHRLHPSRLHPAQLLLCAGTHSGLRQRPAIFGPQRGCRQPPRLQHGGLSSASGAFRAHAGLWQPPARLQRAQGRWQGGPDVCARHVQRSPGSGQPGPGGAAEAGGDADARRCEPCCTALWCIASWVGGGCGGQGAPEGVWLLVSHEAGALLC